MIELIFVGEDLVADGSGFIRPLQHKETDTQLTWEDARQLAAITTVTIRPPTEDEMECAHKNIDLIKACCAYLSQYLDPVAQQEGA